MMKALLLTKPSCLEYVDVDDPTIGPDDVRVKIAVCGICGSDLHGWDGSSGRRHPPLIMGHETSGVVADVGANVTGWKPGDRVSIDSTVYCGECPNCKSGKENLCDNRRVLGVAPIEYRQHGAFAEYVSVPARILHRLPEDITFERAAMVEPVTIALHAVARATFPKDATVLVVGAGLIGLLVIQAAKLAGAKRVIAVDLDESRLAVAKKLGATETLVSARTGTSESIVAMTNGKGVDVSFEVVGIGTTVDLVIESTVRGGTVVLVGTLTARIDWPVQAVVTKELNVLGSCSSAGQYERALELIASDQIQVDPLISSVEPLADGAKWFARLNSPDGRGVMKILLKP
jgi:L-iditol 2-dehydrogenase